MGYLDAYLDTIEQRGQHDLAVSIHKTANDFVNNYLSSFSFSAHEIGLLFGNVQAGKTAQMFGIMCAAADDSFPIIIVLTTDSVALQSQTYERVIADLASADFCICNENETQKFVDNQLRKPAIIVLKKNSRVLLQWRNTLASSTFVRGNSLFVVDDEADAASPNTMVNQRSVSTINSRLSNIRNSSIGSVYLQVTGTPQALLLQSTLSDFRPSFMCYFAPGQGYLGGDFFFGGGNNCIHYIDTFPAGIKDGLYDALIHHLCVSAQLFMSGETVCNFVVHPGVTKASHRTMVAEITKRMEYVVNHLNTTDFKNDITQMLANLDPKTVAKHSLSDTLQFIEDLLSGSRIKILLMNADTSIAQEAYDEGCNIIVGGNVLGRGVTFPKLQTLYYTRTARRPQADTMWQHSRMFGYDRDPGMMAVYLTQDLYKLFSDINEGNNSIISQVERGMDKIQLIYPGRIQPTRRNIIDIRMVDLVAGGVNYYPNNPDNNSLNDITTLLSSFSNTDCDQVSLKMILQVLSHIVPSDDFNLEAFKGALNAMLASDPNQQGILIVRRKRAVTQGTGSLLSPNDRALCASFSDKVVLTMYQIDGNMGWKQGNLWVPDIKLPDFYNYYNAR